MHTQRIHPALIVVLAAIAGCEPPVAGANTVDSDDSDAMVLPDTGAPTPTPTPTPTPDSADTGIDTGFTLPPAVLALLETCAGPIYEDRPPQWAYDPSTVPNLYEVQHCIPVEADQACPDVTQPLPWSPLSIGRSCVTSGTACLTAFDGRFDDVRETGRWLNTADTATGPTTESHDRCCYSYLGWEPDYVCGRPHRVDGAAALPEVDGLCAEILPPAMHRWLADARAEHASIAAFAQLSLDLLSRGAPAHLLAAVAEAQADEVRHAQGAFSILSALVGREVRPGAMAVAVRAPLSLTQLAVESAVDGALNEALAASEAAARLAVATDRAVRAHLEAVVADEARHAELGWQIVGWAVKRGGAAVQAAVDAALAAAVRRAWSDEVPWEPVQAEAGLCGAEAIRAARHAVLAGVFGARRAA